MPTLLPATTFRLLRRAGQAADERQVLILGEARSGTSLLYRTLLQHPAFAGDATNLVESAIVHLAPMIHVADQMYESQRLRAFLGDAGHRAFQADVRLLEPIAKRAAPRWLRTGHDAWWRATGAPLVLRSAYWHARRARGVQRVVDKTPSIVEWSWRLRRALPTATLLYIHRDPVEVFASYRRRAHVDPNVAGTFGLDLDQFVTIWRRRTDVALAAASDRRVGLHLMAYADLVQDPAATLAATCRAIDEPFDAAMLGLPPADVTDFAPDPHLGRQITPDTHSVLDWVDPDEAARLHVALAPQITALAHATV